MKTKKIVVCMLIVNVTFGHLQGMKSLLPWVMKQKIDEMSKPNNQSAKHSAPYPITFLHPSIVATLSHPIDSCKIPPSDPCQIPPFEGETNITALPYNCWHEIFEYIEPDDTQPPCTLKLVCNDFKQAILTRPLSLNINCENKKINFHRLNLLGKVEQLILERAGDNSLEGLKHLTNLCNLKVYYCDEFTGEALKHLTSLRKLKVFKCDKFTGEGLKDLTNLRELEVGSCDEFTDEALKHLTNLCNLKVYWCNEFTSEALKHLTSLRELKVYSCNNFTDKTLEDLTSLQKLAVSHCDEFTGEALKHLTSLRELKVRYCNNFTDKTLEDLTSLQKLAVSHCDEFTGEALKHLTSLRELKVWCCNNFDETLDIIQELRANGCKIDIS